MPSQYLLIFSLSLKNTESEQIQITNLMMRRAGLSWEECPFYNLSMLFCLIKIVFKSLNISFYSAILELCCLKYF